MASCSSGKDRYRDRIAALIALGRVNRKDQARETNARRVYPCPECKGWHLTSRGRPPR